MAIGHLRHSGDPIKLKIHVGKLLRVTAACYKTRLNCDRETMINV